MKNIKWDDTKEYTLEELQEVRSEIHSVLKTIRKKIEELKIRKYNFEGKYVYSDVYGYMYVTWQSCDSDIDNPESQVMYFKGLCYNSNLGPCRGDSWMSYDALGEWRIPLELFISSVEDGRFKEITKEEFMEPFINNCRNLENEFLTWVENIEKI